MAVEFGAEVIRVNGSAGCSGVGLEALQADRSATIKAINDERGNVFM